MTDFYSRDRIIFFIDSPISHETIKTLSMKGGFNIVGVVSTEPNIEDIKKELDKRCIPTFFWKTIEEESNDGFLGEWLFQKKADVFCFMDWRQKQLPKDFFKYAKKNSIKIETCLVPVLYDVEDTVHQAIWRNYKVTGLTALLMNYNGTEEERIISNKKINIKKKETEEELYKRMSRSCVEFSFNILSTVCFETQWKNYLLNVPSFEQYPEVVTEE